MLCLILHKICTKINKFNNIITINIYSLFRGSIYIYLYIIKYLNIKIFFLIFNEVNFFINLGFYFIILFIVYVYFILDKLIVSFEHKFKFFL